jgi:hypothetical protein
MTRVGIVVPFHTEPPEQLEQCITSVHLQTHPTELFLVGDGLEALAGMELFARERRLRKWASFITLPEAHADLGNVARVVGSLEAMAQGCDAIGFLDADNWLAPHHVATLLELQQRTRADVCTASRTICRVDGSEMLVDRENDGTRHVDTSCFLLQRSAFGLLPAWAYIPKSHAAISDRIFWSLVKGKLGGRELALSHSAEPTVFYRSRYSAHYRALGERPPEGSKADAVAPRGTFEIGPPFNFKLQVR